MKIKEGVTNIRKLKLPGHNIKHPSSYKREEDLMTLLKNQSQSIA